MPIGMLVLDMLLHKWMLALSGSIQTLTFVDNWEILLRNKDLLEGAFARLSHFVTLLDLELDVQKTFFWSTSKDHRLALRQAGRVVQNSVKDLGAHVAYTKQLSNHYLTPRILALDSFWERLFHAPGCHFQKVRVVLTAAWPRAFHACSAVVIGRRFMDTVRTSCMRSFRLAKPGASSWLQFAVEPDGLDPLLYVIWSTLRDFRLDRVSSLLPPSGVFDGVSPFVPGNVSEVLVQRLHTLGWRICSDTVVEDCLGQFDLRTVSLQELSYRVHLAWTFVVAQKVQHRVTFNAFHKVDRQLTRTGLMDFGDYEQGILRRHLNGTQITNQTTCFWSETGSTECALCGGVDSLHHRLWQCSGSAHLREALPEVLLNHVGDMPPVLVLHGWTLASPYLVEWVQRLLKLPDGVPRPVTWVPPSHIVDLFIDGSCLWQDSPQYRLASWAVVFSKPPSHNPSFHDCTVLHASALNGLLQSSYRAELMALRVALHLVAETAVLARLWTDCSSVLSRFHALTRGGKRLQPNSPHHDLWQEVLETYEKCDPAGLELIKVDAHRKISDAQDPFDCWCIVGNMTADEAAKRANADRSDEFWALWSKHVMAVERNKLLGVWVRSHIAKVGSLWTNHCPTPATDAVPQKVRRRILPPLVWHGRGKLDIMDRYFSRLFGETFQQHIVAWFDSIWDLAEEVRWVSFAQLFVLYRLQTGAHGVIKLGGKWHVFLEGGEMTPEQFRFSRRCKGFRLMLQALFKAGKLQVHTCTTRPVSQYLLCHIGCRALPLKSLLHDKVEWWLGNNLLRPIRGGSTNLELPRM